MKRRQRMNKRGQKGEKGGIERDWRQWKGAYGGKEAGGGSACKGGGGGEGWRVEVRATEWHSVNCGLMKVLIMELVTFQPVTDPVSLIDPLWSVTGRRYWSVQRSRSCRQDPHEQTPPSHDCTEPASWNTTSTCRGGLLCLLIESVYLIAPINGMMEGQCVRTIFQSVTRMQVSSFSQWIVILV